MSNKSSTYPEGHLSSSVLKSFFSITGTDGNFTYTPGHERFPENWYTRNVADPYGLLYLTADSIPMGLQYPEFFSVGGNTGTVNSFTGVDPADLTGGVYNLGTLGKGNNLLCYALQLAVQIAPDLVTGLLTDVDGSMDMLGAAINNVTDGLGCERLNGIDKGQFEQFPGWTKMGSDGKYFG